MFVCMNTREQGDLGELSAMEWLVSQGSSIYVPIGHSADIDLVAWFERRLVGIQVKTSQCFAKDRWVVALATRGGNQSWNGISKRFSPTRCEYLFVHVGDGRRWFIPSAAVEGETGIVLGGPKYKAFEVEPGRPLPELSVPVPSLSLS